MMRVMEQWEVEAYKKRVDDYVKNKSEILLIKEFKKKLKKDGSVIRGNINSVSDFKYFLAGQLSH